MQVKPKRYGRIYIEPSKYCFLQNQKFSLYNSQRASNFSLHPNKRCKMRGIKSLDFKKYHNFVPVTSHEILSILTFGHGHNEHTLPYLLQYKMFLP
jgi:hypothetical protein